MTSKICCESQDGFLTNCCSFNKFIIAAGNAEQFDGNASVAKALETLKLPSLSSLLPGMAVAFYHIKQLALHGHSTVKRVQTKGVVLVMKWAWGKPFRQLRLWSSMHPAIRLAEEILSLPPWRCWTNGSWKSRRRRQMG